MSKIIAAAGIRGAHSFVAQAKQKLALALEKYGSGKEVGFPATGFYLPVIYGILGIQVKTLGDMNGIIERCELLLPPLVREKAHLPYLGPSLDAGMATLFAQELIEAIRYLEDPCFYHRGENVTREKIWLGAADDFIFRRRGVEFVNGTVSGFAAILGAAPNPKIAADMAEGLQRKNMYVFMAGSTNGQTFSEQLIDAGVEIGWSTRLVPFGPQTSAAIFAFGLATRAAMSFGGLEPGDFRKILAYNKDRISAFVLVFGQMLDAWYATGLGALNYGFPIIDDTTFPQIVPKGVRPYERAESNASATSYVKI